MRTLEVKELYAMPYVVGRPSLYMVGVDLDDEVRSLSALVGTPITLKYKDRTTTVKIEDVSPPHPDHMPPYRIGERIGLTVTIEGKVNGSGA